MAPRSAVAKAALEVAVEAMQGAAATAAVMEVVLGEEVKEVVEMMAAARGAVERAAAPEAHRCIWGPAASSQRRTRGFE